MSALPIQLNREESLGLFKTCDQCGFMQHKNGMLISPELFIEMVCFKIDSTEGFQRKATIKRDKWSVTLCVGPNGQLCFEIKERFGITMYADQCIVAKQSVDVVKTLYNAGTRTERNKILTGLFIDKLQNRFGFEVKSLGNKKILIFDSYGLQGGGWLSPLERVGYAVGGVLLAAAAVPVLKVYPPASYLMAATGVGMVGSAITGDTGAAETGAAIGTMAGVTRATTGSQLPGKLEQKFLNGVDRGVDRIRYGGEQSSNSVRAMVVPSEGARTPLSTSRGSNSRQSGPIKRRRRQNIPFGSREQSTNSPSVGVKDEGFQNKKPKSSFSANHSPQEASTSSGDIGFQRNSQSQATELTAVQQDLHAHFRNCEDPLIQEGLKLLPDAIKQAQNNSQVAQDMSPIMDIMEGKDSIPCKETKIKQTLRQLAIEEGVKKAPDLDAYADHIEDWAHNNLGKGEEVSINTFTNGKLRNVEGKIDYVSSSSKRFPYEPHHGYQEVRLSDRLLQIFQQLKQIFRNDQWSREKAEEQIHNLHEEDSELDAMIREYQQSR